MQAEAIKRSAGELVNLSQQVREHQEMVQQVQATCEARPDEEDGSFSIVQTAEQALARIHNSRCAFWPVQSPAVWCRHPCAGGRRRARKEGRRNEEQEGMDGGWEGRGWEGQRRGVVSLCAYTLHFWHMIAIDYLLMRANRLQSNFASSMLKAVPICILSTAMR